MTERERDSIEVNVSGAEAEILHFSRDLVDSYVNEFGIDKSVVIATLKDFANTAYMAAEGDIKGITNFKRLRSNRHFLDFMSSSYMSDVNKALNYSNFPASNPTQQKNVFRHSAQAFEKIAHEDILEEK